MARVTVEDCVLKVPNRFELVMYSSQRARDISSGSEETIARDNDKNPVIALREIADATISLDTLREKLVLGLQKQQPSDDLEDDDEVLQAMQEAAAVLGPVPDDDAKAKAAAKPAEEADGSDEDDEDVSEVDLADEEADEEEN